MKKCLLTTLILLLIGTNSFGQKIVYDKPDFILHIAHEDSGDGFGVAKAFGRFNNDNYDDLVLLAPHYHNSKGEKVGKAYIFYGSSKGIDTTSYLTIEGKYPVNEQAEHALIKRITGDFNNDGYDDLGIGSDWYQMQSFPYARGYFIVYLSKLDGTGLDLNNYIEFIGYTSIGRFAIASVSADVNGDNIDDLILNAPFDEGYYEGRIYIYYGGKNFDNNYDKVLKSTDDRTELLLLGCGDINGDNYDDVIGGDTYYWNRSSIQIRAWLGSMDMNQVPAASCSMPYKWVRFVCDLNKDNFADIIISSQYSSWWKDPDVTPNLIIIKGASNFNINENLEIVLQGHHSYISSIKDVNNDSINDIFVDLHDINDRGTTYVFSGDETNYVNVSDTLLQFVDSDSSYGLSVTGVVPADMNGDGEFEYYANSQMKPYKDVIFIYNSNFPSLAITYPNITGLEWKTGKEYTITWESKGSVGPSVKLELYKANILHRIISENTDNDGSHKWAVPPELQTGSDFRIKISSVTDSTIYEFSDHFFTIKQIPNLKVTYPDSDGITWYWGEIYKIQWGSWGQVGPNVKLELYKDNLFFKTINFSALNEGYYQKSVSSEETSGENFKIKIIAVGNDSVYDFSDHAFAIFPSVIVEDKPTIIYSNRLYPNYPNPFNTNTKIRYEISQASDVQIRIYNLLGKVVRTMVNSHQSPGEYELNWDGKDEQNRLVAGGIFILELKAEGFVERGKITFLK